MPHWWPILVVTPVVLNGAIPDYWASHYLCQQIALNVLYRGCEVIPDFAGLKPSPNEVYFGVQFSQHAKHRQQSISPWSIWPHHRI
jgi:hypothetical protein